MFIKEDSIDRLSGNKYTTNMSTIASTIDQLMDPVGACLSPEVAQRVIELRADAKLQSRVDELADKANLGALNEAEFAEYEKYVIFASFVTLLQIKAKNVLEQKSGSR